MEITSSYQNQGKVLVIDVGAKFDFSKVEEFRNAYSELNDGANHITVDLSRTEYMDSSALGMLLNMQKTLADKELSYSIENARPQVAKILKISRFDKKFDIK
ncbi:STAS domain-containing protein [Alteromonas portus]|uniref:Anti-sigma factor antagonist n=1 Tax=Alteromonas portus TaxID=2565549 RepID=A0A4U0ZL91_9ALTE|nr:STAS domain-containing protein [Alteromonas portus]TKB05154.1 STAS domain-containing protein [Alteromonas portus]